MTRSTIPGAGQQPLSRNTMAMITAASSNFDAAHYQGIMGIYAKSGTGRTVHLANRDDPVVDFVRCSYLGLDNHPDIVEGALQAVRDAGTLHWSCARTRLNFDILRDLEEDLSDLFDAKILTFTTVLAANMSAMPLLASGHLTKGQKPLVVFDRLAHATLAAHKAAVSLETEVLTIGHNDLDALETLCRRHRNVAYVCDGAYSMGGSAPLAELQYLQSKYDLSLYIDDAHGISLFGKRGAGFARSVFEQLDERVIVAASLGKGFGASGGILMFGSAAQELLFRRFAVAQAFSASMNTAAIGAARASARLHRGKELAERQNSVQSNLALLDHLLPSADNGSILPIRTVRLGDELLSVGAARELLASGYYTSAIFFPTVARGQAGLRICICATHTRDQIEGLCKKINEIVESVESFSK